MKDQSIEVLKTKEFLTVREVAILLNCSIRTAYRLIERGDIKGLNLAERKTLIKHSEISKLFDQLQPVTPGPVNKTEPVQYQISDCYNLNEVKNKFNISDKALHELIKRNGITKIKQGRFTYVPKPYIDKLLS